MKKKLRTMLGKKEARKAELVTRAGAATEIAELRSINAETETLNSEIAELRSMIDALPDDENEEHRSQQPSAATPGVTSPVPEFRAQNPGHAQVLAAYGMGAGAQQQQQRSQENADPYGTPEYRSAFMAFAKTGEVRPELRANAMTSTADVSAVIPTTILNEVIRKITVYGQVFSRVRKMNVKGGVDIPILSLKPIATWIGESVPSDKQKVQANTKLSFSYFGLECKVSVSLLADTVSLDGFETTITDLIVEAMVKAIDLGVIKGNGTGKMLGITADPRVPAAQVVSMTPAEFADWSQWAKMVLAKMPLSYKAGATFLMASGTFEGYINGMTDENGQPIGRVNYGITEGAQERFAGKAVIQVEDDVISPFADAATGDVVAIYCNLANYGFNSNMQMTMFRYFDHDTNEWVDKAILIADGKLIDPNGVVIIKKGVAS
ncbi:phage major capsid protein [Paenibacillus sp. MWE-103]|uniref:Phage major capsid protein n=1 Tax=Paenibacillus artemisiicola TaxID=1172618 RepID=A0ABS3WGE4_9BACL|nr:phage major capsid protein [Paenibacillus artemisiicola]MBO7747360.1 phage major capsid protein [Paenibacillus artemisiicola]